MTPPHRPVGPIAEEASRLLHAAQAWARAVPLGPPADAAHGEPATCRGCPLCQLLTRVRQARPEAVAHLGEAVESLALAVRAARDGQSAAGAGPAATHPAEGRADPPPGTGRVQHIDIA